MQKFLCALLALTLIVSPTGQHACSAAETDTTETKQASDADLASAPDTDVSRASTQEHVENSAPVEALDATQISTNKDERFWTKALSWCGSVLGAPVNQVAGWWHSTTDDARKAFDHLIDMTIGTTIVWKIGRQVQRARRVPRARSIALGAIDRAANVLETFPRYVFNERDRNVVADLARFYRDAAAALRATQRPWYDNGVATLCLLLARGTGDYATLVATDVLDNVVSLATYHLRTALRQILSACK